ncbi:hypothetical protein MKW94_010503 [Papaver nudicaule]|uniref:Uncharacterized protein n=1 Tax=Papaver nudicaule TaxID=74823 RepID=A0AA41SG68_PAPNU|nr:hypothetical protein [Papaver nudicaule]
MENSGVKMSRAGSGGVEVLEPLSEELSDMVYGNNRGCCFWIPCLSSSNRRSETDRLVWWDRDRDNRTPESHQGEDKWWKKGWSAIMKVREWSEIIAGPKWKTFIRRFNKNGNNSKSGKFQYDPLSYALNFDEGPGQSGQLDDDHAYRDFSSRYAAIPMSTKSSMDLGKDGPSFV